MTADGDAIRTLGTTGEAAAPRDPSLQIDLRRALDVLRAMSSKGGSTCKDALDAACQLVSMSPELEWRPLKLLVPGLFSVLPGILSVEYKALPQVVRPLFEDSPQMEDVRPFTKEELAIPWVFDSMLEIWKEGVFNLRLSWGCEIPVRVLPYVITITCC